jgi:cyclohexyl-isocyanide hydratase
MSADFTIVFALFPNLTQLDFTGPYEVLRRLPGARTIVASRLGGELTADGGLCFAQLAKLSEIPACDLLCVPGGSNVAGAMADAEYMSEVRRLGQSARYVTSVCTGSLILAAAGFLRGKRAACHWAYRDLLAGAGALPDAGRVVRDGSVFSGGGVTAGIDFGLVVAAEVAGAEAAQVIQLMIEYAPQPPFSAGRPETAPPSVLERVKQLGAHLLTERREALARALQTQT